MADNIQAVVTGDIVNSTKVDDDQYPLMMDSLKASFEHISSLYSNPSSSTAFSIFRGDSFQGLIPNPINALHAGLIIRSTLRKAQPSYSSFNWDARTAIGIGAVDYLPEEISEGTGEAYQHSGTSLDQIKTNQRLAIMTPWPSVNEEMESQTALLDAVISKWSPSQAEIVVKLLEGKPRKEIGNELDISQAAVHYRIKGAGWSAIDKLLERYKNIINQKVTP